MKLPKNKKNDKLAMAKRRKEVAELYLKGYSYQQIADLTGNTYSYKTVETDIKWIHEQWVACAIVNLDEAKRLELNRIDNLEKTAWEAWDRSCKDAEYHKKSKEFARRVVKKAKGKTSNPETKLIPVKINIEETKRGQSGDPRFLDQVHKCIELRLKVLGIMNPSTINNNTNNFLRIDWNGFYQDTDQIPTYEDDVIEQKIKSELEKPLANEIPQVTKTPIENIENEFPQQQEENEFTEVG